MNECELLYNNLVAQLHALSQVRNTSVLTEFGTIWAISHDPILPSHAWLPFGRGSEKTKRKWTLDWWVY